MCVKVWLWSLGVEYFSVLVTLPKTLAPALFAGRLASQTERVRIVLHEKLWKEPDDSKRAEIERFISYVEVRPMKFTVYNIVPLDTSLLGIVLNICVSYLIIIIQFAHLY